jgi:hypothetical protein
MRRRHRNRAERLRYAIEALPQRTREAMLRGISSNRIVVGAYVDRATGGICPMLAAHRNGGRTSLASFARAWDRYTGAKRPRLATRRELNALRSLLEASLAADDHPGSGSIAAVAARIRAERAEMSEREAADRTIQPASVPAPSEVPIRVRRSLDTGERHRGKELRDRHRWSWMRPARRLEEFSDLVAAAEEQLGDDRVGAGDRRGAQHPSWSR